jgi:hypothetical protein
VQFIRGVIKSFTHGTEYRRIVRSPTLEGIDSYGLKPHPFVVMPWATNAMTAHPPLGLLGPPFGRIESEPAAMVT